MIRPARLFRRCLSGSSFIRREQDFSTTTTGATHGSSSSTNPLAVPHKLSTTDTGRPVSALDHLRPKITVFGVGGAGTNAVNNMMRSQLQGVEFVVANTDAQALSMALPEKKIQLGVQLTQGLGAGARPDVGRRAAEESLESILEAMDGSHMVFVAYGLGGGTGTGAGPVIAQAAYQQGILTVGVVTKPFGFEGRQRSKLAEEGLRQLQGGVDTVIVIPNQNLLKVASPKTSLLEAFSMADNVLFDGVKSVTDLMVQPGLINLDFADVRTVMTDMGRAMMGTGIGDAEQDGADSRAVKAAERAVSNPLLEEMSLQNAKGVLINITGGDDMTLFEVDAAANAIRNVVDEEANIIFGSSFEPSMQGKIRVSVVATGTQPLSQNGT